MRHTDQIRVTLGIVCVAASVLAVFVLQERQTLELRDKLSKLEAAVQASNASAGQETVKVERIVVHDPAPVAQQKPTSSPAHAAPASTDEAGDSKSATERQPRRVLSEVEVTKRMAAQFGADPVDRSSAASAATKTISSAVSERAAAGVQLEALECRQRMCRAQLAFRDADADREVTSSLFRGEHQIRMGGLIVPERTRDADGRVTATVYIAREGNIELD
jgi:hypothetical protein